MSTPTPPELPTPGQILGPLLVGAFLSTLTWGLTLVQFFSYYEASRNDPKWMKIMVISLFVSSTLDTALNILVAYQPLVLEFGMPPIMVPFYLRPDGILTVVVSTPVQLFFAWRILVLTHSKLMTVAIGLFAVASFVGGFWTSVALSYTPFFAGLESIRVPPSLWLMASAVADIMITVALVHSLRKKMTGFDKMDSYLSHIMRLTIQTGAFTSVAALTDVMVFFIVSHTTIFFAWDLSLSKLYINSLLSSLNARNTYKERNALFNSDSSHFSDSLGSQDAQNQSFQLQMPPQGTSARPGLRSSEATSMKAAGHDLEGERYGDRKDGGL